MKKVIKFLLVSIVVFLTTMGVKALEAPTLNVQKGSANSLLISWNEIEDATGYKIYRSTSKTGTYSLIKTLSSDTLAYTNKKLSYNSIYYYKVLAYNLDENSEYSNVKGLRVLPDGTTAEISNYAYNSIKLSWSKVSTAKGYVVYRSTSEDGTYSSIARITSNASISYTDKSLTLGEKYYYKVRSYVVVNDKNVYSAYSDVISQKVMPGNVSFSISSYTYTSLKLSWSKVSGATSYRIYQCSSSDISSCELLVSTDSTSYIMKELTLANTYKYSVKSCRKVSGKTTCGYLKEVKEQTVVPKEPVPTFENSGYKTLSVTWDSIPGATQYSCVYKLHDSSTVLPENRLTLASPNCTINNLQTGQYYDVYIRSEYVKNFTVYSSPNVKTTIKVLPNAPKVTSSLISYNKAQLFWNPVSGATNYKIYRATSSTGSYSYFTETTSTSLNVTIPYGKTYYYKVRAYVNTVGSAYSNIIKRKAYLSTPKVVLNNSDYAGINISVSEVDFATGYQIYRATSKTGTYSKIKTTKSLSYTNTGLTNNKTYYYKVRAYVTVGDATYYGSFSSPLGKTNLPIEYKVYPRYFDGSELNPSRQLIIKKGSTTINNAKAIYALDGTIIDDTIPFTVNYTVVPKLGTVVKVRLSNNTVVRAIVAK